MESPPAPDHLFGLRNSFYIGAYQAAINGSDVPNLSPDEVLERDTLVHRAYIALGSYQLVISEIDSSAPTALQAVKLLALYLAGDKPKLHYEGSSDKIVTGASGIESLQTQIGLQPQRACENVCESIPTQPVFHTEPSSDRSKSGGKRVQAQPRLQLQTTLENSFVNLYGQPKLHTEHGSDKMSTSRSGVESLQSQSGVQLQKELANDCESNPTQWGFHTKPFSDKI